METYHKINTIFKRDMENGKKLILGQWSQPEFEYLADNRWEFTEKVDGTNIRVGWDSGGVHFGGRTDNASIPAPLLEFLAAKFMNVVNPGDDEMILFGEGYGPKIQGGGKYRSDTSFVLFDVKVGKWWLKRDGVEAVGKNLGLDVVPITGYGTLYDAVDLVKSGLKSTWGDFEAEGIVARPAVAMFDRGGNRIIAKIKGRDFL